MQLISAHTIHLLRAGTTNDCESFNQRASQSINHKYPALVPPLEFMVRVMRFSLRALISDHLKLDVGTLAISLSGSSPPPAEYLSSLSPIRASATDSNKVVALIVVNLQATRYHLNVKHSFTHSFIGDQKRCTTNNLLAVVGWWRTE